MAPLPELTEAEDDFLWFARTGEVDELKDVLLQHQEQFNVNCQDPVSGNTALHMACANGHAQAVEYLLQICHVDQSIRNLTGSTALHWAVTALDAGKDVEICKLLLLLSKSNSRSTADVLLKNSQGKGSTSLAIQKGNMDLVKILLEHSSAAELDDGQDGEEVPEEEEGAERGGGGKEEEEEEGGRPSSAPSAVAAGGGGGGEVQTMDSLYNIAGDTKFVIREMGIRPTSLQELAEGESEAIHQTHFTVWAASIILARWASQEIPSLKKKDQLMSVVELGAGTGLAGVAVHRLCAPQLGRVLLTDLKIESHLQYNCDTNRQRYAKAMRKRKHRVPVPALTTCAVDWTDATTFPTDWVHGTDVLLGSDLVYDVDLVGPLVDVCAALVKPGGTFFYVTAVTNRAGMDQFLRALERTFKLEAVRAPSPDMLANPLGEDKRALFELHLADLVHVDHLMYRFRRL